MRELVIVGESAVEALIDWGWIIEAVERSLRDVAADDGRPYPTLPGSGLRRGTVANIKYGALADPPVIGLKLGTYWPGNEAVGGSNHSATTLLLEPTSGLPLALINATQLNRYRTAAADAVATTVLARADARCLAVLGTGAQAAYEVRAVARVRTLEQVLVVGRDASRTQLFIEGLADLRLPMRALDAETAVRQADIVVTATTATAPIVRDGWVRPGTHISAMGADRRGKAELDPALFARASLYADLPSQSLDQGEFQARGTPADVDFGRVVAIGAVLAAAAPGRRSPDDITIFDSSGLAAQDLRVAHALLTLAFSRGLAQRVPF